VIKLTTQKNRENQHLSKLALYNPLRKLFINPKTFNRFVSKKDRVADLGCGSGYFTIELAKAVGPDGVIYAVDPVENAIKVLNSQIEQHNLKNVEVHVTSAADIGFIQSNSIDFVLAWELLCCVSPPYQKNVIDEIKRIMKPEAKAYLSVDRYFGSYVNKREWGAILKDFDVITKNNLFLLKDRSALVKMK
jgi:ubiquinone/menaquinone biosynthesis C-methylase UbiE